MNSGPHLLPFDFTDGQLNIGEEACGCLSVY